MSTPRAGPPHPPPGPRTRTRAARGFRLLILSVPCALAFTSGSTRPLCRHRLDLAQRDCQQPGYKIVSRFGLYRPTSIRSTRNVVFPAHSQRPSTMPKARLIYRSDEEHQQPRSPALILWAGTVIDAIALPSAILSTSCAEFRLASCQMTSPWSAGGRSPTPSSRSRADWIRLQTIDLIAQAGLGHYSSTFSAAELVATLYYRALRLRPASRTGRTGTGSCSARATWPPGCGRCSPTWASTRRTGSSSSARSAHR